MFTRRTIRPKRNIAGRARFNLFLIVGAVLGVKFGGMKTLAALVAFSEALTLTRYTGVYTPPRNTGRYNLTAKQRKKKSNRLHISKATKRKHRRG